MTIVHVPKQTITYAVAREQHLETEESSIGVGVTVRSESDIVIYTGHGGSPCRQYGSTRDLREIAGFLNRLADDIDNLGVDK